MVPRVILQLFKHVVDHAEVHLSCPRGQVTGHEGEVTTVTVVVGTHPNIISFDKSNLYVVAKVSDDYGGIYKY